MPAPENNSKSTTPCSGTTQKRWLSIVGIGEDGLGGLSPTARSLIENAELVVGGKRHLALAGELIKADCLAWPSPITDALDTIAKRSGRPIVVLASGDPFHYGVGTMLAKRFQSDELFCLPQPSAFSISASRLSWSMQDVAIVSVHGRELQNLYRHLHHGARILALSWDETTPIKVAAALNERGLGQTRLTVLEALGGPNERVRTQLAHQFDLKDIAALNTLAIELPPSAVDNAPAHAFARLTPGLADDAFESDGQITKRDIRAMTVCALNPRPGEHLWDIGLGAGSIAIEWLLCHPSLTATGFEKDKTRAARALANAATLGATQLEAVTGPAPDTLNADRPAPDVVFIGGGLTTDGVFDAAWSALRPGGRLVANAVTLESEARLSDLHARFGGELLRIETASAQPIGRLRGWRSSMPIVQWRVTKPEAQRP